MARVSTDAHAAELLGGRWTLGVQERLTASQTSSSVRANARMVYDAWPGSVFPCIQPKAKGGLDSLLIFAAVLRIIARTRSTYGSVLTAS